MLNNKKINLSNSEKLSLDKIRNNDSIIIKPADKGGANVIMSKTAYINEAYRQLNNNKYYVKLDRPVFRDNITKINNILKIMKTQSFVNFNNFFKLKIAIELECFTCYLKFINPVKNGPNRICPKVDPLSVIASVSRIELVSLSIHI